MYQQPFGNGWHDSLQYHAFCDDKLFAVRLFWTQNLWHHSVWIYDGEVREILNSEDPLVQSEKSYADLSNAGFSLSAPDDVVTIDVDVSGNGALNMQLTPQQTLDGPSPIGPGLHHPNMQAEVTYQGETLSGLGYCKRYDFRGAPIRYWGYRFVHGTVSDHQWALWTADATFGRDKHAYFRVVGSDGIVQQAPSRNSCHRDNNAYGIVDGIEYDVELDGLEWWETRLKASEMDSLLSQRLCRMKVHHGNKTETGFALNELCFGTLG